MDQHLYSNTLEACAGEISNPDLRDTLAKLAALQPGGSQRLLKWDDYRVAVPVTVAVDLPPLGNYEGVDIREAEPLLLVFHLENYPAVAPRVYPDRPDFPKDRLAHLYVAVKERPPAFCLIRSGNEGMSEWYANKQVTGLVTRASNWLRDAAAGTLTEDSNQFEPLRLESYNGALIYDYDKIAKVVRQTESLFAGLNFALAQFERINDSDGDLSWKHIKPVPIEQVQESREELDKEKEKDDKNEQKKFIYFGYIVWSASDETYKDYDVLLPDTWESFKKFCSRHGIDTAELEEQVATRDPNVYLSVPIIVAIKRPKNIIGYNDAIEFVNFHIPVSADTIADGKIKDDTKVTAKIHRQPVTMALAARISDFSADLKEFSMVAGCGALGARICVHLVKSGSENLMIADPGKLTPHNFVRHPLPAKSVNINKAIALVNELQQVFSGVEVSLIPIPNSAEKLLDALPTTAGFDWLFDFTASHSFLNDLIRRTLHPKTRVCKAYISDGGNLGVVLFEGEGRNPRIDDLQVLVYWQSMKDASVSDWLNREAASQNESSFVTIGIGCHSETTILSDDIVANHASVFSGLIKGESKHAAGAIGKVYLNTIQREPYFQNQVSHFYFKPVSVMDTVNSSGWQVRVADGILEELHKQMHEAMPRETGGVFVGCANYKTRTIHVVAIINAPPDSKANEVCFFRGIEGLPAAVGQITEDTGRQLGYIGEWHSHPQGPDAMSPTDASTVLKFHKAFAGMSNPIPVLLIIVTPTAVLPFVYA